MSRTKKIALAGVLAAVAVTFGWIERLLPAAPIPGIKLGLANTAVLITLYILGGTYAVSVSLIRVFVNSLLGAGLFGGFYALCGAGISVCAMILAKKTRKFGVLGVSVVGGVSHNLGQIFAAVLFTENTKLFFYFPILILSGIAAGVTVGLCSWTVISIHTRTEMKR